MKTKKQTSKLQILTVTLASGAFVLSFVSLWQSTEEREMRLLSEESFVTSHVEQAVRVSRLEMCVEQNIDPCNLTDTTQPVDLRAQE